MSDIAQLQVKLSQEFHDHLMTFARANKLPLSEYVRRTLARATSYDLAADDALRANGRPKVYLNDQEKQRARNERQRKRDRDRRDAIDATMRALRLRNVEELQLYLLRRGTQPSELGMTEEEAKSLLERQVA